MDLNVITGGSKIIVNHKKLVAGERDWTHVKEVLGQILDMEAGTFTFP